MILRPSFLLLFLVVSVLSLSSAKKANSNKKTKSLEIDRALENVKRRNYHTWKDRHHKEDDGNKESAKNEMRVDKSYDGDGTPEEIARKITGSEEEVRPEGEPEPRTRRSAPHPDYMHTVLTPERSPLRVTRVDNVHEKRKKRAVFTNQDLLWDLNIPYVIDSSFSNYAKYTRTLKRAMRVISENVCLTFTDVTDTYDDQNPNWFTENNFTSNSYMLISAGSECAAVIGPGSGGAQESQPCFDYEMNVHILLHTIGVGHMQQSKLAEKYLTINVENIIQEHMVDYEQYEEPMFDSYFDPSSVVMYDIKTWSKNNFETYTPIRDDIFDHVYARSLQETSWYELNHIYQCNAKVCGNNQTDCGHGYFAKVKGRCRCRCPQEYDASQNCQSMTNGPKDPSLVDWPDIPMTFFAGNSTASCPNGFSEGTVTWTGYAPAAQKYRPEQVYAASGNNITLKLCSKTGPSPAPDDWEAWPPGGAVCFLRGEGATECLQPFEETIFELAGYEITSSTGVTGGLNPHSYNVTWHFCCKKTESVNLQFDIPDSGQIRLMAAWGTCPTIRGLYGYSTRTDFYTSLTEEIGNTNNMSPDVYIYSSLFRVYYCDYVPPFYGCSEEYNLDANTPSVTITTPGYGQEGTDKNKRCFYVFYGPENSQLRLTIHDLDILSSYDFVYLKRFHKWQNPFKITEVFEQIMSESNYLSLEMWTGAFFYKPDGMNFTVEVVLPENMGYNASRNGADYMGPTSITETYEQCLPWNETVECSDFPSDNLWLLDSGSACRNPGGALLQPWCYKYKKGRDCHKGYCNVGHSLDPIDVHNDCASLIATDPYFCTSSSNKYACFKSCSFTYESYTPPTQTCGPPTIPSDGEATETLKSSYQVGEQVVVKCTEWTTEKVTTSKMTCLANGWTSLPYVCSECPPGWAPYGTRCFLLSSGSPQSHTDAYSFCADQGSSGSLFQVRDLTDNNIIVDHMADVSYNGPLWLSCDLQNNDIWKFDDTSIEMTYFNWSSTAEIDNNVKKTCFMIDNNGKWDTVDPDGSMTSQYVCQVDKYVYSGGCVDSSPHCSTMMTTDPKFCENPNTVTIADMYCLQSCGVCGDDDPPVKCSTPFSSTYERVSPDAEVAVGATMTFACNSGLYYVGGDLTRACASTGEFLGAELICSTFDVSKVIGYNNVRKRQEVLPEDRVLLLDGGDDTIPMQGRISDWYYYCDESQTVYFVVFRENAGNYTYVGHNEVVCSPNYRNRFPVALQDQVYVEAGDIVGVYSDSRNTIMVSDCNGAYEENYQITSTTATSMANLQAKSIPVSKIYCMVPSIAYNIQSLSC